MLNDCFGKLAIARWRDGPRQRVGQAELLLPAEPGFHLFPRTAGGLERLSHLAGRGSGLSDGSARFDIGAVTRLRGRCERSARGLA
jgi:hypothetical protein